MSKTVDTTEKVEINVEPQTVEEEVLQNLWFLFSTIEYQIPLDRGLGLTPEYVDKPIETAKALAITDLYDKVEQYEPRAEIVDISFKIEPETGILKPIVEVEINGEYDNEEYTE